MATNPNTLQRKLSPTNLKGHQTQHITEETNPNKPQRTPIPTQRQLNPTYYGEHQSQHGGN